jgi:hypothetical protein
MAERLQQRETDSIGQIRPHDGVFLQYRERGGGAVVAERRLAYVPQWRKQFPEGSPILAEGMMLDTTHVDPTREDSRVRVKTKHTAGELELPLDPSAQASADLGDDVVLVVDVAALSKKVTNRRIAGLHTRSGNAMRVSSEVQSFRS